ncbi:trypsin-like peptidase domain-containing protein [Limnoglobus roseus]|uniref:PDZ domain-containing protein n=1 Tax=Limnoglobus roseus TaxID=2598579 RepID=A0A5C1A425_9BACT|nr:trypsin-like peptidase domain-containing protein [Limnoglobus roseus]QEL13829.1 PDZ domain-containing protein [Limnoglobus roseus]
MSQPARSSARSLTARFARRCLLSAGFAVGGFASYMATAQMPATPTRAADRPLGSNLRRDAMVDIVERMKAAVVNIHSERTITSSPDDPFRGTQLQPQRVKGMGTGIVLDPRGYVVTNFHVIDDIQTIRVTLSDGKSVPARVIATDKKADLALVKIEPYSSLPLVTLGTATDLLDAETVIAIGNAFGYEHSASVGNVSYKSRDVALNKEISYTGLIQTTAPINPGNSGGPLFNKKGELVGVNVAIRAGAQNIAFAIPVDTMIERAAEMLASRKRGGAWHGLVVKNHVERADEESPVRRWVTVDGTEANSPASAAGLKTGDLVEQVGDLAVTTTIDVERGFLERPAGAKVSVRVRRGSESIATAIQLGATETKTPEIPSTTILRRTGLKLSPMGKDAVAKIDPQLRGGLLVTDVIGPAAKAGIQKGDLVIGFHLWEALNVDNVMFVLNHKELATFNPVKTFFVREGKVREAMMVVGE